MTRIAIGLRKVLRRALQCPGLEVRSLRGVPFGVQWWDDMRFFPDGRDLRMVFDVGANCGQTAAYVLEEFPGAEIYSFEPVEATFAHLTEFASRDARVKPFRLALGATRGTAIMSADPKSGENTLVRSSERVQWSAATEVPVDTVAGFCAERGISRIDLLKIDTEGYEMEVLRGAEPMLANGQIRFVLAECDFLRRCHGTGPHGDFVEMLNYLDRFGYALVAFYNGGVDDHGWIWGDALFRRKGAGSGTRGRRLWRQARGARLGALGCRWGKNMDGTGKKDADSANAACGFRRLTIWRRSKDLAVRVYRLCREGPIAKDFSLRDQIQRSAVSVCSNIVEGDERESDRDSIRFFLIAKGSLAELATQVEIASEIGYFSASVTSDVLQECREIARMIGGLIKARSGGAIIRRAQVPRTQSL